MKRFTRNLLWSGSLLLILGIGAAVFLWFQAGESEPPGSAYLTAKVSRGDLQLTVSSTGTLAAVETVDVGTEVSGTVEKVLVDYNDHVSKGQVLAVLKPDLFNAAVAEAQGSVDQAKASLQQAREDLERNRPLFEKGYISAQEYLPYQTNLEKTEATLASARASLARAKTNLGNATIHSPIDGTVIQRSVDAGQTVAASLNTPTLFVIAKDLSKMQIEAAVDETDIGQIRTGQRVNFTVQSYPDKGFSGTVRQIRLQPTTVQNVVTYTVIVSADNREGLLLPGMTATVDFIVAEAHDALLVPNAALRFRPEELADKNIAGKEETNAGRVYVLGSSGQLQPVVISTGISDGQGTVVKDGALPVGTEVVTGYKQGADKPRSGFSLFGSMRGKRSK